MRNDYLISFIKATLALKTILKIEKFQTALLFMSANKDLNYNKEGVQNGTRYLKFY